MPPKRVRVKVNMTSGQANEFINKLALEDDMGTEFRSSFEADPVAVLAYYGIEVPQELVPATITLPSVGAMREVQGLVRSEEVEVTATAATFFPIFTLIFPHVALSDS